jgi:glycosyltransferase involved in cell wall biosynthesis
MKVCLNTHYPLRSISGVSKVVTQIALGLKERGIDIFVVSSRLRDELEVDTKISIFEIDVSKRKHLRDLYLARKTFSILFKHRDEYDIIHSHSPHLSPMMAAVAGKIVRKPVITTIHGKFPRPKNLLLGGLFKVTTKITFLLSDRVTFVNEEAREYYRIPTGIVIENGIDAGFFLPDNKLRRETRAKLGISDNDIALLYVGRLSKDKGIFELLEAFSKARTQTSRPLKLVFVGEGETEEILDRVEELGIDRDVILSGTQTDVMPFYCAADIFVLYSMHEGLPMVLLEAASCGLAIVSTRVGGIPALIKDKENGLLLDYGDTDVLVGKLVSLADDESLRQQLGKNARNSIIDGYTIDKTIDRYMDLYNSLIKEKRT